MDYANKVTITQTSPKGLAIRVTDERGRVFPLAHGHEFLAHLQAGARITIEAVEAVSEPASISGLTDSVPDPDARGPRTGKSK